MGRKPSGEPSKSPSGTPTENPSMRPSAAPVGPPTVSPAPTQKVTLPPTALPTASPTKSPPPCVSDKKFRINGINKKSCAWLGAKGKDHKRITKNCSKPNVLRACKLECGECCEDDPTYTFTAAGGGKGKTCEWLGERSK